jgi:hypothetical protein
MGIVFQKRASLQQVARAAARGKRLFGSRLERVDAQERISLNGDAR